MVAYNFILIKYKDSMEKLDRIIKRTIPILLILSLNACEDQIVNQCNDEINSGSKLSTLSEIQMNVFDVSCATSGCHIGPNPPANLNLEAGNSFSNLVNVSSILYPGEKRVVAFESENSILIKTLRGTISTQMPAGSSPLPNSIIDSIAVWIDEGAKNN